MFFPDRIKHIEDKDLVLEIGPGGAPFYRSDILLDKDFSAEEARAQRGETNLVTLNNPLLIYNSDRLPFKDNVFGYTICSLVLEHVPIEKVSLFIDELCRISSKGYIEFPRVFYDYIFNIDVHKLALHYRDGEILILDKKGLGLNSNNVQNVLLNWLIYNSEKLSFIDDFKDLFTIGFEWRDKIRYKILNEVNELIADRDIENFKIYFQQINKTLQRHTNLLNQIKITPFYKLLFRILLEKIHNKNYSHRRDRNKPNKEMIDIPSIQKLLKCPECGDENFDYKDDFYICKNCTNRIKLI